MVSYENAQKRASAYLIIVLGPEHIVELEEDLAESAIAELGNCKLHVGWKGRIEGDQSLAENSQWESRDYSVGINAGIFSIHVVEVQGARSCAIAAPGDAVNYFVEMHGIRTERLGSPLDDVIITTLHIEVTL